MSHPTSITAVSAGKQVAATAVSEETLNQITHGIGFALSIVGAVHLLSQPMTSSLTIVGSVVYCAALVAMFGISTLSHSFDRDPLRERFRTLDQICIFVFMAAIFTPVSLRCCSDGLWNVPLFMMWIMAAIGTWLKLNVAKREMVSVWFYMALGAIPMVSFPRLLTTLGTDGVLWVLGAACCYLVGLIFLTNDHRHRYFHPVWHICVIMGSFCHYMLIYGHTIQPGA